MIDHISLGVTDLERSTAFYDTALRPLGIARFFNESFGHGYGATRDQANFWIGYPYEKGKRAAACPGTHVAFVASSRSAVDAFYEAALAAGGRDNGKPGLRPEYH